MAPHDGKLRVFLFLLWLPAMNVWVGLMLIDSLLVVVFALVVYWHASLLGELALVVASLDW